MDRPRAKIIRTTSALVPEDETVQAAFIASRWPSWCIPVGFGAIFLLTVPIRNALGGDGSFTRAIVTGLLIGALAAVPIALFNHSRLVVATDARILLIASRPLTVFRGLRVVREVSRTVLLTGRGGTVQNLGETLYVSGPNKAEVRRADDFMPQA